MTLTEFLLARIYEDEHNDTTLIGSERKNWHTRWLAECEAKRRIVELHAPTSSGEHMCVTSRPGVIGWKLYEDVPCLTLRHLASVYAEHPDCRDEWKP